MNGTDTKSDSNQMLLMMRPVLCFVTRALKGNKIATNRSQEIADSVRTDDVRQVTAKSKSYMILTNFAPNIFSL